MKKIYLLSLLTLINWALFAQNSGLGFNYQAVVRNAYGLVVQNSNVRLRISLFPGQQASNPTWVETHSTQTDDFGTIGITVGKGIRENSSVVEYFSDVNFAAIYYWMKIEIEENGTFRELIFTQLPSTPYSEAAHNASVMPAGTIVAFGGELSKIPHGWMLCDGSEVSRSEYSVLYNAIGVAWGYGDNATTFNIPDLRGMFLRGVSYDSGYDLDADDRIVLKDNGANSGNNVGSYQNDNFKAHKHTNNVQNINANSERALNTYPAGRNYSASSWRELRSSTFDSVNSNEINETGGSETRPKNVYVNYIIKY